MKQRIFLVLLKEFWNLLSHLNVLVKGHHKVNVLMNFTEKQALVEIDQLLLGLQVDNILLIHFPVWSQLLLVVDTVDINWGFGAFVL